MCVVCEEGEVWLGCVEGVRCRWDMDVVLLRVVNTLINVDQIAKTTLNL